MKPLLPVYLLYVSFTILSMSACTAQKPIQQVESITGDAVSYESNTKSTSPTPPSLPLLTAPLQESLLPKPSTFQTEPAPVNPTPTAPQPKTTLPKRIEQPARSTNSQQKNSKRLTLSQLIKKYPNLLLLKGPATSNKVALTFDDAPDSQYTPQVLDILKKYQVKATFFLVGRQAEKHPNMAKRIAREGHIIGNHSYNHALFTKLTDEQFVTQITRTQKVIKATIGYAPKLIRPPYGEITETQLLWASSHHYNVVNWSVDSIDWKQLSEQQVSSNILSNTKAGSIILQHSGGGPNQNLSGTVGALPTIIETLRSRGYQLVTLPDLLKITAKQP
jgi:polysaccharide deacetylase family sporulation protein PdaB